MEKLTETELQTIVNALYAARDYYKADKEEMVKRGSTRLAEQFERQRIELDLIIAKLT